MTERRVQANYQVRLGWGLRGLETLAQSDIVVLVDVLEDDRLSDNATLTRHALSLAHEPAVFAGNLRNATATAHAVFDEQLVRGSRTSINLVLAGDGENGFAVEDYLAAGAIADALIARGIDHSAPDVAVAAEGFRALTRALKHLVSASAAGVALKAAGRGEEVKRAAELDAEREATRLS